jgi:hypothetical protein
MSREKTGGTGANDGGGETCARNTFPLDELVMAKSEARDHDVTYLSSFLCGTYVFLCRRIGGTGDRGDRRGLFLLGTCGRAPRLEGEYIRSRTYQA